MPEHCCRCGRFLPPGGAPSRAIQLRLARAFLPARLDTGRSPAKGAAERFLLASPRPRLGRGRHAPLNGSKWEPFSWILSKMILRRSRARCLHNNNHRTEDKRSLMCWCRWSAWAKYWLRHHGFNGTSMPAVACADGTIRRAGRTLGCGGNELQGLRVTRPGLQS